MVPRESLEKPAQQVLTEPTEQMVPKV
jgi:hypothetical protein